MHRLVSFRVQKNVRKAVDCLASTEDWQMPGRCRRMPAWGGKCLADTDGCPLVWQMPGRCRRMPAWSGKCLAPADAMRAGKCPTVLRMRPALFCRLQDLFQFLRR